MAKRQGLGIREQGSAGKGALMQGEAKANLGRLLPRGFFERSPKVVGPGLLGKLPVKTYGKR